jgi:hypothetical protein
MQYMAREWLLASPATPVHFSTSTAEGLRKHDDHDGL